jgi:hypothetical protein
VTSLFKQQTSGLLRRILPAREDKSRPGYHPPLEAFVTGCR